MVVTRRHGEMVMHGWRRVTSFKETKIGFDLKLKIRFRDKSRKKKPAQDNLFQLFHPLRRCTAVHSPPVLAAELSPSLPAVPNPGEACYSL